MRALRAMIPLELYVHLVVTVFLIKRSISESAAFTKKSPGCIAATGALFIDF